MIREVNGAPNWLPPQNALVAPGVVIALTCDLDLTFMAETGTSVDAILAGLKANVLDAVASANGSLAVGAVATAAASAPGVSNVQGVTLNGSPTDVPAPVACAAEYVSPRVRTIR